MKKFTAGKVYEMHSICDWECVWRYKVIGRTAKTIVLSKVIDNKCYGAKRFRLSEYDGSEQCYPLGKYSMCPVLRAESEVAL